MWICPENYGLNGSKYLPAVPLGCGYKFLAAG